MSKRNMKAVVHLTDAELDRLIYMAEALKDDVESDPSCIGWDRTDLSIYLRAMAKLRDAKLKAGGA